MIKIIFKIITITFILIPDKNILGKTMDSKNVVEYLQNKLKLSDNSAVGFDVDDTILFSAPGFWLGYKNFSSRSYKNFTHAPGFWDAMNNEYDKFSMIKSEVANTLYRHLLLKHKVYFITRRPKTKSEKLSEHLRNSLKKFFQYTQRTEAFPYIEKLPNVIFSNEKSKAPYLTKLNIKVYYGDSDSDKLDTEKCQNIYFVRILRAPSFIANYDPIQNISKNEIILKNSNKIFGT